MIVVFYVTAKWIEYLSQIHRAGCGSDSFCIRQSQDIRNAYFLKNLMKDHDEKHNEQKPVFLIGRSTSNQNTSK